MALFHPFVVSHDCHSSSIMGDSITWARKKRSQKFPHLQKFNFIQCFNSCFYSSQSGAYLFRGAQLFSLSAFGAIWRFFGASPYMLSPNVRWAARGQMETVMAAIILLSIVLLSDTYTCHTKHKRSLSSKFSIVVFLLNFSHECLGYHGTHTQSYGPFITD